MSRYTTAYSSFAARLVEVELLRRNALMRERSNAITFRKEIDAFCRGAVVLLCAHLEAYVKDLGEVALTALYDKAVPRLTLAAQFYYHISKELFDEIKNTTDHGRIADKLFDFLKADLTYWDRSGAFPQPLPIDRFNKGFASPSFDKIAAYLNRFGYSDYKRDLGRTLKADYLVTINMVERLVDVRNKIAHGDPAATQTPNDVKDMMAIIRAYCLATDTVFGSWFKENLCSIR